MRVLVNGDEHDLGDDTTVGDVVRSLGGRAERGVAVSLNGEVVPRSEWSTVVLHTDDAVEVLSAIGGG